ncbi:hypothetical protein V1T75_16375, partial [Tenacibaculum sp. FZY0031]|uniref:hypothetical protein n=1 Tax=Tenacibaculum sp. FZY0031 TaxID=3116648 RepID=UPI002E9A42B9|nr:hypothetical protein [Tenacibaculum sp. FZY0031]
TYTYTSFSCDTPDTGDAVYKSEYMRQQILMDCGPGYDNVTYDGYCVDTEEQIINKLEGKAECVFNKLLTSGISNYHNMITDLFIEFGDNNIGGRNLTFKMSSELPDNIWGDTKKDDETGDYIIFINSNVMSRISSIGVAAVLVHEISHAFLGKHYNDSNASFSDLYQNYINDTDIEYFSHDIMKDQFINRMATVLKNYHPSLFSSFEDYKILCSRGVFELSDLQKTHLINTINKARQNDENCP